jgi:starvation-inducible outer membrane lipoprotein
MDVLKSKAMLKALKWILIKYGKIEDVQAQKINKYFYSFLSIGMSYYQEGCNLAS